jgi:hypothetical protein
MKPAESQILASDPRPPREKLRTQLVLMRESLIARLATQINGGDLALLGSVGAALAALDQPD